MLESYGPPTHPVLSRSRLALEIAAELVGADGWPYQRAHIDLRQSDFDETGFGLIEVAALTAYGGVEGGAGLAMINPSAVLTMPIEAPARSAHRFRCA